MQNEMVELFEAEEVPSHGRRRSLTQVLVTTLLILLALGALLGASLWFYSNVIYQQTDRGQCLVLKPNDCRALSSDRIEEVIGQPLPITAEVVESGSSFTLKYGTEWVLLRADAPSDLNGLAKDAIEGQAIPSIPQSELDEKGFVEITRHLMRDAGSGNYTLLYFGTDARGNELVYLSKQHNL
ncbi:MAG: hypothetical protein GX862_04575 [Leucobacter sp.]|nr:hypothetical protein [Leucobacter sp.]